MVEGVYSVHRFRSVYTDPFPYTRNGYAQNDVYCNTGSHVTIGRQECQKDVSCFQEKLTICKHKDRQQTAFPVTEGRVSVDHCRDNESE